MSNPIVVYDSGLGGISILNELKKELPQENFVYFADNLNVPYGNKSENEIETLVYECFDKIMEFSPKAVVIACNTITATTISKLRTRYNVDIIGTEPNIKQATFGDNKEKILVLCTLATANSFNFVKRLSEYKEFDITICPLLNVVKAIENDVDILPTLIDELTYVDKSYKKIVLGCTHFSFIKDSLHSIFTDAVFFESCSGVARRTKNILISRKKLIKTNLNGSILLILTHTLQEVFKKYIDLIE